MTRRLGAAALAAVALAGCGEEPALSPPGERLDRLRAAAGATPPPKAPSRLTLEALQAPDRAVPCREPAGDGIPWCFGMHTVNGNRALHELLELVTRHIEGGAKRDEVLALVSGSLAALEADHLEVYDTAVIERFTDALDPLLAAAGMPRVRAYSELGR